MLVIHIEGETHDVCTLCSRLNLEGVGGIGLQQKNVAIPVVLELVGCRDQFFTQILIMG